MASKYELNNYGQHLSRDDARFVKFLKYDSEDSVVKTVQRILRMSPLDQSKAHDAESLTLPIVVWMVAMPHLYLLQNNGIVSTVEDHVRNRSYRFPSRFKAFIDVYMVHDDSQPVANEQQVVSLYMQVYGPTKEHVRVSEGVGGVYFCVDSGVTYLVSERTTGRPSTAPTAVREAFFLQQTLLEPTSTKYTDQTIYVDNAVGYGVWSFHAHAKKVHYVLDHCKQMGTVGICVPGDASGTVTWHARDQGFLVVCGDKALSPLSPPEMQEESAEVTMRRALESGIDTIVLGYLGAFLHEEWEIVQQFVNVYIFDIDTYVPPISRVKTGALYYNGSGIWTTNQDVVSIPSDYSMESDIPFSVNLIANAPYSIGKVTRVSEYVRQMMPAMRWEFCGTTSFKVNAQKRGYLLGGPALRLVSGIKELDSTLCDELFYFAKIGRVVRPIQAKDGTRKFNTRSLYWSREGDELYPFVAKMMNSIEEIVFFYAVDPRVFEDVSYTYRGVKRLRLEFTDIETPLNNDEIGQVGNKFSVRVGGKITIESTREDAFRRFSAEKGHIPDRYYDDYEVFLENVLMVEDRADKKRKKKYVKDVERGRIAAIGLGNDFTT